MPDIERTEGTPAAGDPSEPKEGLVIIATPFEGEQPQEKHFPDGGFTIFLRGEIYVTYQPPAVEAPESPVADAETPTSGLLPDSTSQPISEPHSGAEKRSWEQSLSDVGEMPESENEKFVLEGNPARVLGYRVTRKSNTRMADFVLATHPDKKTTEYWRIRAFGDQAEKVRDQVEVGQKGVEVTVYGPKYWKGRRKIDKGYEDTVVKGYHAGFVKVPKEQRQEKASGESQPGQ